MNTWRCVLVHALAVVIFLLAESNCVRKFKRTKDFKYFPPRFEHYTSDVLPNDKQISVFLKKREAKTLYYTSKVEGISLTVTLATCTSTVTWSVKSKATNTSNIEHAQTEQLLSNLTTNETDTFRTRSSKTIYVTEIFACERDTYVHVYLSTEPGGPQAIQTSRNLGLKLSNRHRRKQLTVSWEPSLVDPQSTIYCLVVNIRKHYRTLCSAQGEKYGLIPPPEIVQHSTSTMTTAEVATDKSTEDTLIACVGHHTHYTVKNMAQGVRYFFDLFAINKQSNLTYHRGSSEIIFNNRFKPAGLRDGKYSYVNLKKYDGRVVFRFKVQKTMSDSLKLYITPCGGAVDIEVSTKGSIVSTRRRVEGYDKIVIDKPKAGIRYYIKVVSTNREELRKTSGVEILATTRPFSAIPLPNMPSEMTVEEYKSLRQCDSVTIGWIASPDQKPIRYCINMRQIRLSEVMYDLPNQCDIEKRLRKSKDYVAKYCRNIRKTDEEVITQKIQNLKPGRNYEVQVTVKKSKGKTLSYNVLYVKTKPSCNFSNSTMRLKKSKRKEQEDRSAAR